MDDVIEGGHRACLQKDVRTRRKLRRVSSSLFVLLSLVLTGVLSGCANVQGVFGACDCSLDRSLHMTRAQLMARRVWSSQHASCYSQHCDRKAVRRGFIDGFVDVAGGGDGCPPVFPPQPCCLAGVLQSPYPQCRDQAWFEGYPMGAAAAEQQGCHLWYRSTLPAHLVPQYRQVESLSSNEMPYGQIGQSSDASRANRDVVTLPPETPYKAPDAEAKPEVEPSHFEISMAAANFSPATAASRIEPAKPDGVALVSARGDGVLPQRERPMAETLAPVQRRTPETLQPGAAEAPTLLLMPTDVPQTQPLVEIVRASVRWSEPTRSSN